MTPHTFKACMRRFRFLNKEFIQFIIARNNTEKLSLKAQEPLPVSATTQYGENLTISDDRKYVVVGDGILFVKVTASMQFYGTSATSQTMVIRRDRNGGVSSMATANGHGISFAIEKTIIINVQKGDKLYIVSGNDCTLNSASTGGLRSGIIVEKIV